MKLRNKKTGEIFDKGIPPKPVSIVIGNGVKYYDTIDAFNEEWEDYEDDEYWHIDWVSVNGVFKAKHPLPLQEAFDKEIGNYFETKEEAEKAVEKLKAWKRLKDKGFKFDGYDVANSAGDDVICGQVYFKGGNYDREEIEDDLYLLFGGEE